MGQRRKGSQCKGLRRSGHIEMSCFRYRRYYFPFWWPSMTIFCVEVVWLTQSAYNLCINKFCCMSTSFLFSLPDHCRQQPEIDMANVIHRPIIPAKNLNLNIPELFCSRGDLWLNFLIPLLLQKIKLLLLFWLIY